MKLESVLTGILAAFLLAFISSAFGIGQIIPGLEIDSHGPGPDPDQDSADVLEPVLLQTQTVQQPGGGLFHRIKRQIPFIGKWLSGLVAGEDGDEYERYIRKKMSAASSNNNNYNYNAAAPTAAVAGSPNGKGFVSGSIVAKPGPPSPPSKNVTDRDGRFLSLFTVVRFDNTECLSASGDNGTCYPSNECYRRGGSPNGKCAQGYGVCCIFSKSCGASTNQNATYFTHSGYPTSFDGTGSCQLTVYKSSHDICQIRLDFDSFNIAQPGSNGICNNDQFIVSGSSSQSVPIVCGINSGNHMYIDVAGSDNSPVTLSVVTSGPTYSRSWKIKITQIRCHSISRSPEGCLQYHQGVSGVIRSYNFDFAAGQQLSNQDYTACIRMERNFCGIRYTACTDTETLSNNQVQQNQRSRAFSLTGQSTVGQSIGAQVSSQSCQTDWITIPCATNSGRVQQLGNTVCQDRICGDVFNSEASQVQMPVFSYSKPFRITLHTDSNETNDLSNRGFCLNYIQQPCTPSTQ